MKTFDNCALFVGVNDYRTFDESTGKRPGTSDLAGSRNDVMSFYRVCREMGIAPENIRVVTSPRLAPADLEGMDEASIREATEAEILDGAAWLAKRIGARWGSGGDSALPALFTYSGHGDWKEGEGLVICPADTSGNNLDRAIPLVKLQAIFAKHRALGSLTVVLDCCHSGSPEGARKALSLTGRNVPPALAAGLALMGERVLSASAITGTSYQSRFAGQCHGAFSWALTSAMDQWTARPEGKSVELTVSYGDLLERAKGLLATLGLGQTPALKGPPGVEGMPFFHRGRWEAGEQTAKVPDRKGRGGQLNPDMKYSLSLSSVTSESWIVEVSAGTSDSRYPMNTELWEIDGTFLQSVESPMQGDQIVLSGDGAYQTPATSPPVQMPAQSLWTQVSGAPDTLFWGTNDDSGDVVGLVFDFRPGTPWTGTMTWYVGTATVGPPEYAVGSSGITLTYGPASESPSYWYAMTLPPLSWPVSPSSSLDARGLNTGIGLAALGATLCCAYVSGSESVYTSTSTDLVSWSNAYVGVASNYPPQLAATTSTFYLAFADSIISATVHLYQSTNGSSWSSAGTLTASQRFALGVYTDDSGGSELLCFGYLNTATSQVMVQVWTPSGVSGASGPGTSAVDGALALAGFGENLYLAQQGSESQTIEIYEASAVSTAGTTWSSTPAAVIYIDTDNYIATSDPNATRPTSPLVLSAPSLAAWNGLLYLSFKDSSNNLWICSSVDGASWSGFAELGDQFSGVESANNTALAGVGTSTLALAYVQSSYAMLLAAT